MILSQKMISGIDNGSFRKKKAPLAAASRILFEAIIGTLHTELQAETRSYSSTDDDTL